MNRGQDIKPIKQKRQRPACIPRVQYSCNNWQRNGNANPNAQQSQPINAGLLSTMTAKAQVSDFDCTTNYMACEVLPQQRPSTALIMNHYLQLAITSLQHLQTHINWLVPQQHAFNQIYRSGRQLEARRLFCNIDIAPQGQIIHANKVLSQFAAACDRGQSQKQPPAQCPSNLQVALNDHTPDRLVSPDSICNASPMSTSSCLWGSEPYINTESESEEPTLLVAHQARSPSQIRHRDLTGLRRFYSRGRAVLDVREDNREDINKYEAKTPETLQRIADVLKNSISAKLSGKAPK